MTRPMRHARVIFVLLACGVSALAGAAQQPAPTTPPAPAANAAQGTPSPAPAGQTPAAAAPAYSYQAEGRRDPFVSLLGRGADPKGDARPNGLPGMLIDELSVKGIIKLGANYVAIIQGPDNKSYPVRPGDKLMDGSVKSITADSVIFSQDVNDPLSTVKQREKIKKPRSNEGGRE